jgi:branched-chain amino acid transport system substrate-binding protein
LEDLKLLEIPLFSGLDRINLAKLIPELERVSYQTGEILFNQGDPGDSLFIIIDGIARVFIDDPEKGEREINTLGRKECFGEMALLTGEPRSASIQAVTELSVLKLSKGRFDTLLKKHHSLVIYFAGVLARRLATAQRDLQYCKEIIAKEGKLEEDIPATAIVRTKPKSSRIAQLILNKPLLGIILAVLLCSLSAYLLYSVGIQRSHIVLIELTLAAAVIWSIDILSFYVVAISLPILAVLVGVTTPEKALSGFSNPAWFLVLGVFAISAAISKTGLLYRLALLVIKYFPPNYTGKTMALAFSGLILTPVIPSSNARAALAAPMALNLSESLRFKDYSPGSIGLAMSCLLGFGQMSSLFMNGAAVCFLIYGLLPVEVISGITWGSWLIAALPMGIIFFLLSYLAIALLYHPKEKITLSPEVIKAQLKTLGPLTAHEKISLITVVISILGFLTQPWHGINGAWVSMLGFFILFGTSVLDEKAVRSDIDWNFLISFGAMVGFGNVISSSGLTNFIAKGAISYTEYFAGNRLLFLLGISLAMHLLRLALPITPALLIGMLAILPVLSGSGVNPFVAGLVLLISSNPFLFPHQNMMYMNIASGTEGKMFRHEQIMRLAFLHIAIVLVSIALTVPYWKFLGLIR